MKRFIISGLVAATFIQSTASARDRDLDVVFGTVGAVTGGILGHELGNDDTRVATTILGVIGGAMIGHEIGRALDESDRRAYSDAQRRALQGRVNERYSWKSSRHSRSGARGEVIILREGRSRRDSLNCREYRSVINIGQRQEVNQGIACQRRDGSWYEVNEQEVSFNGVIVQSERTESRSNSSVGHQNQIVIQERDYRHDGHDSRPSYRRSREEYKCVSLYNNGSSPYVMAVRNTATYDVVKMNNLVFSSMQKCQSNIDELTQVDDDIFTCASQYANGSGPYSLFFVDRDKATQLELSFSSMSKCKESLGKARITRQVVALCSSRYNNGSSPWVISTIDRETRRLRLTDENYSSLERCYNNL